MTESKLSSDYLSHEGEGCRQVSEGKEYNFFHHQRKQQQQQDEKKKDEANFFREYTVKSRPHGLLGIVQMITAYVIMFALSSFIPVFFGLLFYLLFSLIYFFTSNGIWTESSNFVTFYTILLGILIIQGMIPLTLYKNQDLIGASNFWLLREFVNYFPMTCTVEEKMPLYEEDKEIRHSSTSTTSISSLSTNENIEIESVEREEKEEVEEAPSGFKMAGKKKNYMFALYPHALIPVAVFMTQYFMNAILPGEKVICLIHSGIFNLPFLRFWMAYSGGAPATKSHIQEVKRSLNAHAAIVVGGVAEMFLQSQKVERIKMRKGFIREAIRNGYDIVPVYYFGHTNIFSFLGPKRGYQWLAKHLPFPFFLYYGRNFTTFPRSTPVKMCVGRPIDVKRLLKAYKRNKAKNGQEVCYDDSKKEIDEEKEENGSVDSTLKSDIGHEEQIAERELDLEEEVNYILSIFKSEISRLYYKHKPEWEDRSLCLVE